MQKIVGQDVAEKIINFGKRVEFGAVQTCANLVELQKWKNMRDEY